MAPTFSRSDVAEGMDKDSEVGCIVGQPRAKEKQPKHSRGENVSWHQPPLSPFNDITDGSL